MGVGVRAYWMCTLIAMLATEWMNEWMNGRRTHAVASECVSLSFYQLVSQRSKIENTPNSMLKAHFPCSFTLIGFWIALSRLISLLNEHYAVNQSLSSNTEQNGKDIAKNRHLQNGAKNLNVKKPIYIIENNKLKLQLFYFCGATCVFNGLLMVFSLNCLRKTMQWKWAKFFTCVLGLSLF